MIPIIAIGILYFNKGVIVVNDAKKKQIEYIANYQKEHYDVFHVKTHVNKQIKSRLEILCISTGKSKNQLITEAIEKLLQDNDL